MKTEITKIKITLGKREIELDADEARKLHDELGKLFKHAEPIIIREREIWPVNVPVYPQPIVVPQNPPWWQPTWIMCGGNDSGTLSISC